VTNPRKQAFPFRSRHSGGSGKIRKSARRRPSAGLVASVAIVLAGALLLAGGFAWAHGRGSVSAPSWDAVPDAATSPAVDVPTDMGPENARAGGLAVCVRLCDGFFFPSATNSGGDEACAAQCPDAPTARYTEAAGSDRIEDAVSTHGALYTALPTASRYRTTLDNACTCHRSLARDYSAAMLNDPTLRKGDVVVTPKGFLVFQGSRTGSITPSDFVALSQARSLPKELRAALVAMERGSAPQPQVGVDATTAMSAPQSNALAPLASAISAK
jgi:hypothetical protein